MKILKKIAAGAAMALVAGTFVTGVAAAANNEYVGYSEFGKYTFNRGEHIYTNAVQKADFYDYAVVYFETGSIGPSYPVYYSVATQDTSRNVTPSDYTGEFGRHTLDYYDGMGNYSEYYRLYLGAGYYGISIGGKWAP